MIAAYLRVSSELQAAKNGTDAQRTAIVGWCMSQHVDADSVRWYEDVAVSGKTMRRPQWEAMLEAVAPGDTVIAYDLSRCGRNLRGLSEWMHKMLAKKVRVVFVRDSIDITTMTGRLVLHILGAIAEWEREAKAETTRSGYRSRAARGERWGGARLPVGSVGGPKFSPEQEAEIQAALKGGESPWMLAKRLGVQYRTIKKRAKTVKA